LNPLLKGRPVAVHQHEDIISVSYEARALGVKKHMTPAEAVAVSNDAVVLVPMQTDHGSKVSYRVYREASARVLEAAKSCSFLTTAVFEKASIDEFYVDVSALVQSAGHEHKDASEFTSPPQTATNMESQRLEHSPGQNDPNTRAWPPCVIIGEGVWPLLPFGTTSLMAGLVCGVLLPEEDCLRTASFLALKIRDAIQLELGFSSSAGVAPNKLLAKIASGLNKPRNQTVILHRNVPNLMHKMPLRKLPRVLTRAGHHALADLEQVFNVSTCGELIRDDVNHSRTELVARYGEASGSWLYTRARGDDDDAVKEKPPQKTIACSMSLTPFGPKQDHLLKVLNMIAAELADRLRKDVRRRNQILFAIT
jgi:DNA polymerase eta